MKKNKIVILITVVTILIIVATVISIIIINNNDNLENSNKQSELTKDQEISKVLFSNMNYIYEEEETKISLDITNNNNQPVNIAVFTIELYDSQNNYLGTLEPNFPHNIGPGSKISGFEISIGMDYSNAERMKIELPNLKYIDTEDN